MHEKANDMVSRRQEPLRRRYRERPSEAGIVDHARTASIGSDPFHGTVVIGDDQLALGFGIHRAVGGDHDASNPGDILCAALAACLDSTLRMTAARMGVALEALEVQVRAIADVRGCLLVDRDVPAGFQRIDIEVGIKAAEGVDPAQISMLTSAAERCCVVLQTLRSDLPVGTRIREPAINTVAD
ncbi:MAG: OsmC family protein [Dichotomicrobium sp.]